MEGSKPDVRAREQDAASLAVLALNNAHAEELTALTAEELQSLFDQAFAALVAREGDAFLIALDEGANYESPNFLWFRERYDRFVYVDRVAVAAHARGQGFGRALYEALFERARAAGHALIVSEVNADPPHPTSDAFHVGMGFAIVGAATLQSGKRVRYYARALGAEDQASAPGGGREQAGCA